MVEEVWSDGMVNIEEIENPEFIKTLSNRELNQLCEEIRSFLVESISKTGGHLSSNLGVVELTVAMHKVFNTPEDKLIFDVGHQAYVHKILTGRATQFETLRQFKGLSGFPKRKESDHDCWETGHASTSISAGVGMAYARDLAKDDYHVISIIGDGSMTGGMAYEAINHIGHTNKRLIIILNDNEMAIGPNVGAMHNLFSTIRINESYVNTKRQVKKVVKKSNILNDVMHKAKDTMKRLVLDDMAFASMGIKYLGPIDGHNMKDLVKNLEFAKNYQEGPILLHVKTVKGKGYSFAEKDKLGTWHGIGQFNPKTGEIKQVKKPNYVSWSQLMCNGLIELTKHDERVAVITPAMISGSALGDYLKAYPERLIDVGIAEEHAVTMAGGMATQQMKPFVSIYSTFFKRAYDQVHHDICRQNLDVVFGVDRAGIVGADGETHQGLYDIAMLRHIPNIKIMMPRDAQEAYNLLLTAYTHPGPFAIRYPRGEVKEIKAHYESWTPINIGSWDYLKRGKDAYIISMGPVLDSVLELTKEIEASTGYQVGVINARYIKPLDVAMLQELASLQVPLCVYEESTLIGGLGTAVIEYYNETKQEMTVTRLGVPDVFVEHGAVTEVLEELQLSLKDVWKTVVDMIENRSV